MNSAKVTNLKLSLESTGSTATDFVVSFILGRSVENFILHDEVMVDFISGINSEEILMKVI